MWFDGYEGEETILFDDFDKDWGVPYRMLLQITDRYPMQSQQKGGWVHRMWTRVIITCNEGPKDWYPADNITQLERRITESRELV